MPTLPVVLAVPARQSAKCARLAAYVEQLDGTKVDLVPISRLEDQVAEAAIAASPLYSRNKFACLQATSLRKVALLYRGRPFIWLEPDSIPLKPGWAAELSAEYARQGRPYLLSSDCHPPFDLVGGIGVYGPDTYWQIPDRFSSHGWDLWMKRHIPSLIGWTPLIQHKYCTMFEGHARPLRGSTIKSILREDALIFHRDVHQELLDGDGYVPTVHHTGEMGDIIAALPIFRHMGGVHLTIGNHPMVGWRKMSDGGWPAIKPLLDTIPYIRSVTWSDKAPPHAIDMSHWREFYQHDHSLTHSQARSLGIPQSDIDMSPWIGSAFLSSSYGVIVARSARYHNPAFDWPGMIRSAMDSCSVTLPVRFVGTEPEYKEFIKLVPKAVYTRTANMLELRDVLSTAEVFIGNQSSPWWLARAMGMVTYQETHDHIRDSIIGAPNANYFH